MAEKLAALQVVKDRLDAAGLGDFCFELHSDKAHPKSIIDSLQRRHELSRDRHPEPPWKEDLKRLRSARGRVREYLSALHELEGDDHRTSFQLFWAAIAARRALTREFEAVRRVDLTEIFRGNHEDSERCSERLKLFGVAIGNFEERYGLYAESPLTKAKLEPTLDSDPLQVADIIKDTYSVACNLSHHLATASRDLGIDLPQLPSAIIDWIEIVQRVPNIPEHSPLPRLSSFKSTELSAAAELAEARLELVSAAEVELPNIDPTKIILVGGLANDLGLATTSPSEIIARLASMQREKASLVDGLKFFSSVLAVFKPRGVPTVAVADAVARTALFAKSIPPNLDDFLDFDREAVAGVLVQGAQRLKSITVAEGNLRSKFRLMDDHEWPSADELRNVAEVAAASGLRKITLAINGRRRRAREVARQLNTELHAPTLKTDIEAIITHVDSCVQFYTDDNLASAASPHWSDFNTPLRELVAVLELRADFDRKIIGLAEVHQTVKSNLFSRNRKLIEALRSYHARAQRFLESRTAWPESISDVPLAGAQSTVGARVDTLTRLAKQIKQHGLSEVDVSLDRLVTDAYRRTKIRELEKRITSDPVLCSLDEQLWLSPLGCRALRQGAELSRAITSAVPPGELRNRLLSAGAAKFSQLLHSASGTLRPIVNAFQSEVQRLVAVVGSQFISGDKGVTEIVTLLESCLPAV